MQQEREKKPKNLDLMAKEIIQLRKLSFLIYLPAFPQSKTKNNKTSTIS